MITGPADLDRIEAAPSVTLRAGYSASPPQCGMLRGRTDAMPKIGPEGLSSLADRRAPKGTHGQVKGRIRWR